MTTIYECPKCGSPWLSPSVCRGSSTSACVATERVPVRMFREDDVRPLVKYARVATSGKGGWLNGLTAALKAFPEDD